MVFVAMLLAMVLVLFVVCCRLPLLLARGGPEHEVIRREARERARGVTPGGGKPGRARLRYQSWIITAKRDNN